MNNLNDYIKIYEKRLEKSFCKKILTSLNNCSWEPHQFYKVHDLNNHSRFQHESEPQVYFNKINESQELEQIINECFTRYLNEDIYDLKTYYGSFQGFYSPRFTKYTTNSKMEPHVDHIHSMFDGQIKGIPVLSLVGALNDDYDGGEFAIRDQVFKFSTGSIIIFPSVFLYPHCVKTITKGNRFVFVSWAF